MVPGGVSGASRGQQETLGSSNEPSLKPPLAAQHGSSYANCDDLHVSTTHALSHCDKHEGHKSGRSSRVQQLTPMPLVCAHHRLFDLNEILATPLSGMHP